MKLFFQVLLALCLISGAAFAAKKIIYFTDHDTPTTAEKAAITTLSDQAAAPYRVVVRSSRRARLRATPESADYLAGASIPPNYRDGGIDSGTPLHTIYDPANPPDPEELPSAQAILRNGDIIPLAGGGRVVVAVSGNAITVSSYRAPDAGGT